MKCQLHHLPRVVPDKKTGSTAVRVRSYLFNSKINTRGLLMACHVCLTPCQCTPATGGDTAFISFRYNHRKDTYHTTETSTLHKEQRPVRPPEQIQINQRIQDTFGRSYEVALVATSRRCLVVLSLQQYFKSMSGSLHTGRRNVTPDPENSNSASIFW